MNRAVFEVDIYDGEEHVETLTFASSSAEDTTVWVHELNKCFGVAGKGTAAGSAAAGSGDTVSLLLAKKTIMDPAEVQKIREMMEVGLNKAGKSRSIRCPSRLWASTPPTALHPNVAHRRPPTPLTNLAPPFRTAPRQMGWICS